MQINTINNKIIKLSKKLRQERSVRNSMKLFCCETYKVVKTLLEQGLSCEFIIYSKKSKYLNAFANQTTYYVDTHTFSYLTELETPDGVFAVFKKPEIDEKIKPQGRYLILNKIQNPGNLSTILRSALAFNFDGVLISNDSVDFYKPEIIRKSMGYIFGLNPVIFSSFNEAIRAIKSNNITCLACVVDSNAIEISSFEKKTNGVCFVLGNEGKGLSDKEIALCDEKVYVEMTDKVESLNVSVAASILMYTYFKK